MTAILIYFIVTLLVIYINATGCYIRGMRYPWKEDMILSLFWPIGLPLGILIVILENK